MKTKLITYFVILFFTQFNDTLGQQTHASSIYTDSILSLHLGGVKQELFFLDDKLYQQNVFDTLMGGGNLFFDYEGIKMHMSFAPTYELDRIDITLGDSLHFGYGYSSPFEINEYSYGYPLIKTFQVDPLGNVEVYSEKLNDKLHGCLIFLDPSGDLYSYAEFANGIVNGWSLQYSQGILVRCEYYEMGVLIATY